MKPEDHAPTPSERAITTLELVGRIWSFCRTTGALIAAVGLGGWTAAGYVYGSQASDDALTAQLNAMDERGTLGFRAYLEDEKQARKESDARWIEVLERLARIEEKLKRL